MVAQMVQTLPAGHYSYDTLGTRERRSPKPTNTPNPAMMEQRLRQQLARELHDGPVQLVSNATMNLMVVQKQLEHNPELAQQELANALETMQRAVQEMRSMLYELRPIILESEGLVAALKELVAHLEQTTHLEIELDCQFASLDLSALVETNIYYIVQEAVQNVYKHARAKRVQIRLYCFDDTLHLSIRDDGQGFNLEHIQDEYEKRKSLGLLNLYERAQMIHGHLAIDTLVGRGTTVRLTVPLLPSGL